MRPARQFSLTEQDSSRFLSFVSPEPNTGCWLWTGGRSATGYGAFWLDGSTLGAHRVSYHLHGGSLDPNLVIDHLCRNRLCVNPSHIELVTQKVNTNRGDSVKACKARKGTKTHCPHGHAFDEANTIVRKKGERVCRICKNYNSMMHKRDLRKLKRLAACSSS